MKKTIIGILKYVLIFIILIIIYVGSLYLNSLYSSEKIKDNVKESAELLVEETEYCIKSMFGREICLDNYTDSLMINNAFSINNEEALYSALIVRRNYINGITQTKKVDEIGDPNTYAEDYISETNSLLKTVNNDITEAKEYAKYWHGYLIVLRPLLIILNYSQIRIVQAVMFLILTIWLCIKIKKEIDIKAMIIFLVALLSVDYYLVPYNMEASIMFYIMFISSIFLLYRHKNIKDINKFFFVVGSVTSFFDFLTAPLLGLGVPLILYFLLKQKDREITIKETLKIFILSCIAWGIGYIITWITKFIIVDILYNKNLLYVGYKQVIHRTIGLYNNNKVDYESVINGTISNLQSLNYLIIGIVLVLIIIILMIKLIKNYKKYKLNITQTIPYLLVAILPFAWYAVLNQHSYRHFYFTYRALILTIMSILLLISVIFKKIGEE